MDLFREKHTQLPKWHSGKESCQCRRHKRHSFGPWVRKIPRGREWQPAPVFLPGKSHGQKKPVGFGPPGCKGTTEQMSTLTYFRQNVGHLRRCEGHQALGLSVFIAVGHFTGS